jgi:hypothetical protein
VQLGKEALTFGIDMKIRMKHISPIADIIITHENNPINYASDLVL